MRFDKRLKDIIGISRRIGIFALGILLFAGDVFAVDVEAFLSTMYGRHKITDVFNGVDLPAGATMTSSARSVVDYQGKLSPTPANTIAVKGGRQAATLAEGAVWGPELQSNNTFASWSGDNPAGWTVSTENGTNYVTQDAAGCKMVSDGAAINMVSGVSFTRGARYHIVVDVAEKTGSFIHRLGAGPGNTDTDLVVGLNTIDAVNNGSDVYGMISRKFGGTPGYIIIRSVSAKLSSPTKWLDTLSDGTTIVPKLSIRTTNGSRVYYRDVLPSGTFKRCDIATGVVLSLPTDRRWRQSAQGFSLRFVPGATGQTAVLFSTYVDANNSTSLIITPTEITIRKKIGGVDNDATISYTHASGKTFDVIGFWSSSGFGIRLHSYESDILSTWSAWEINANGDNAQIASTLQVGGENGGSPVTGNVQFLSSAFLSSRSTIAQYENQVDDIYGDISVIEPIGDYFTFGAFSDSHYNPPVNADTTAPVVNEMRRLGVNTILSIGDNYNGFVDGYTTPPYTNWVTSADMEIQVADYESKFSGFQNVLFTTGNHDKLLSGSFTEYWEFSQYCKKNNYLVVGGYRIISIHNANDAGFPYYSADSESLQYLSDQLALAIASSQDAIIIMHVPEGLCVQLPEITAVINAAVSGGAKIRMVLYGHGHVFSAATIGTSLIKTYALDGLQEYPVFYKFNMLQNSFSVTEIML